jgi:hypothetical protein
MFPSPCGDAFAHLPAVNEVVTVDFLQGCISHASTRELRSQSNLLESASDISSFHGVRLRVQLKNGKDRQIRSGKSDTAQTVANGADAARTVEHGIGMRRSDIRLMRESRSPPDR